MTRVLMILPVTLAWLCIPLQSETSPFDAVLPEVRIPSVLRPCEIHAVIQRLGRVTQVPVGFQAGPECLDWKPWGMDRQISTDGETIDLAGLTLRQALNRTIVLAPDYGWKEMDGVAVARPVNAWRDLDDVLNKDVAAVSVANQPVQAALYRMLQRPEYALYSSRINAVRASFAFPGGTRLDGLNALTRTYGLGGWEAITVAKHPPGYPDGPLLVLGLRMKGPPYSGGITTFIPMRELER